MDVEDKPHDKITHHLAHVVMTREACLFSQHIPGKVNDVDHSLSQTNLPPEKHLPPSDPSLIPGLQPSIRNCALGLFLGIKKACIQGSEEGTKEKQDLVWLHWGTFLFSLGLYDPLFPNLYTTNQCLIPCAFMHTVCKGGLGTTG
eukprot:482548-Ditylum_brightwellii.AAC.1